MKTFLLLEKGEGHPEAFPAALVEAFIRPYTISGEIVLDPFAGTGTTLRTAEALGRRSIGVEFRKERYDEIAGWAGPLARVVHGDSRRIDELGLPECDLCITSPPYMHRNDAEDPLQAYTVAGAGYDAYLTGLRDVFARVCTVLKPGARCVINVCNIDRYDGLTTLAWDVAGAVSEVMTLEKEHVVCWRDSDHTFGYDHEYCLLFRNT